MSLLKPVDKILRDSGLKQVAKGDNLESLLEHKNLGKERFLDELENDLRCSNETVHHSAVKVGLQMHKLLKDDDVKSVPSITFVIHGVKDLENILTPRE